MGTERLVVGDAAAEVRRRLGPTAWVALETLAAQAHEHDGDLVVAASVRGLANDLGLAKNTAMRALHVLREGGVLVHVQRRAASGTFAASEYAIRLARDVLHRLDSPPTTRVNHAATRARRSDRATVEQLVLLPE